MPSLVSPRLTYHVAEGLKINYDPAYDDKTMMPQLVEGLFVCADGVATSKDVHPLYSPPSHSDRMVEAVDTILAAKSYTELNPKGSRPFEAGQGGYGWYYLSPAFKEVLRQVFSSDEETAVTAAINCFDAMDKFSPNMTPNDHELGIDRFGESGYTFRAGTYSLKINEGSVHNITFDRAAGIYAGETGITPQGDTISHINHAHSYQKMGLLLGIGSIAHTVWRHSLPENS